MRKQTPIYGLSRDGSGMIITGWKDEEPTFKLRTLPLPIINSDFIVDLARRRGHMTHFTLNMGGIPLCGVDVRGENLTNNIGEVDCITCSRTYWAIVNHKEANSGESRVVLGGDIEVDKEALKEELEEMLKNPMIIKAPVTGIWHFMPWPGVVFCNADYPNLCKTDRLESVTCPTCLELIEKASSFQQEKSHKHSYEFLRQERTNTGVGRDPIYIMEDVFYCKECLDYKRVAVEEHTPRHQSFETDVRRLR